MEAGASTPLGVAELVDRTRMCIPVCMQTRPIATPRFTPNYNCLAPGIVYQSDKTGDGECLLHQDEKDSTAEQEQLRKQLAHK